MTDNSLDVRTVQFSGLASRMRRLDASMLLWLALIAVLAFLILNPILRLIISSLQETDSGKLYARQLPGCLRQYSAPAGAC